MRGGRREGAGRPKGSKSKRTLAREALTSRAVETGATPLEVMLLTMRDLLANGNALGAAQVARDAAPYVHPRLSAVHQVLDSPHESRPKDLQKERLIDRLLALVSPPGS